MEPGLLSSFLTFQNLQIATLAQGLPWDEAKSPAQNHVSGIAQSSSQRSLMSSDSSGYNSYQSDLSGGYQGGGDNAYQSQEFRDQKEAFFNKKQEENYGRPE
jgi:ADP-ribosylation factor GTPase-activating protein 1